jgi:hypothetical protein
MVHFLLDVKHSAESKEDREMKKARRVLVPTLASLVFGLAVAVWAGPTTTTTAAHLSLSPQDAAQTQSVSGTISAVGKDSFTLSVTALAQAPGAGKSMVFMVDTNTTVDGKLMVGSKAEVTYRVDKGQNIAVSVRVSS